MSARFKTCSKCQETKPILDFYPNPRMADRYTRDCKVCRKAAVTERRALKPVVPRKAAAYHPPNDDIDLGLAVLRAAFPHVAMSPCDIAEVCGCHFSLIYAIEKKAMRKVSGAFKQLRREGKI